MIEKINNFITKTKDLKVAVIGETIVDEFISVQYEGQSMKSFCPVFKLNSTEKIVQQGGALAIANHLRNFTKQVDLFSNDLADIVKTRLIDSDGIRKHVEINKFETKNFKSFTIDCTNYDVVIVADFGHGVCDNLEINDGFHLMCQTNSNNFGFNRLSKWKHKRKKGVCVDLREASLQINKKLKECSDEQAKEIFNYELNTDGLFITLGAKGSLYANAHQIVRHPSFKSNIVDTIGAGDTFYSFATLASLVFSDPQDILLIPSLAASLSTTWLCNEQSVTPEKLLSYASNY